LGCCQARYSLPIQPTLQWHRGPPISQLCFGRIIPRKKKVLLWSVSSNLLVSLMSFSNSSPKFLQIGFVLTSTSLWTKSNQPSLRIDTSLILWLVLIRFLQLHTILMLRWSSLSLTSKRSLILLVETFSLSYHWQKGLGNNGLDRSSLFALQDIIYPC